MECSIVGKGAVEVDLPDGNEVQNASVEGRSVWWSREARRHVQQSIHAQVLRCRWVVPYIRREGSIIAMETARKGVDLGVGRHEELKPQRCVGHCVCPIAVEGPGAGYTEGG